MLSHKLISFSFQTNDQITIEITLLKEALRYFIRTECFNHQDKLKEINSEIERNDVYQIFCYLEAIDFDNINEESEDAKYCLKIYYGKRDWITKYLTKSSFQKQLHLKKVILLLVENVDNQIVKDELQL